MIQLEPVSGPPRWSQGRGNGLVPSRWQATEGSEDVDLAGGSSPRWHAAEVPVPHASRLAAASHSSRPSMGMS